MNSKFVRRRLQRTAGAYLRLNSKRSEFFYPIFEKKKRIQKNIDKEYGPLPSLPLFPLRSNVIYPLHSFELRMD